MGTGGRIVLPSKKSGETIQLLFDMTSAIPPTASLTSCSSSCSVYSGTDPNPSAVLSGLPGVSPDGKGVLQTVIGGVAGVIYQLLITGNANNGNVIQQSGLLAIEATAEGTP